MTEPIDDGPTYDLTGYLADQIDAFAGMIEQRDLARSVAVGLEGELHAMEIERDAEIARADRAEALNAAVLIEFGRLPARVFLEPALGPVLDCLRAGHATNSPRPEATS